MTESSLKSARLSVELDSDLAELSRLRSFCQEAMDSFWPADDADKETMLSRLQLAANEAVANVIEHAYQFQAGMPIICRAGVQDQAIQLEIAHCGRDFAPPDELESLEEPAESGMGLFLIEQSVSKVTYRQLSDGRHCVELRLNLPEPPGKQSRTRTN